MYGRQAQLNYDYDSVKTAKNITTYVEIWKVMPELSLSIDKDSVDRGDTFTVSMTISNHYDNMEGLPKTDEVSFQLDNATAVSDVTKTENVYKQTFKATEDKDVDEINVKVGVLDATTNYKENYKTTVLPLTKEYNVSYEFVSGTDGVSLPDEVLALVPKDEAVYKDGDTAKAVAPEQTTVKVDGGTWTFKGYDADEKNVSDNVVFTGTWEYVADQTSTDPQEPTDPQNPANPQNPTDSQEPTDQNQTTDNQTSQTETQSETQSEVQTGDQVNVALLSILSLASLGCIGLLMKRKEN